MTLSRIGLIERGLGVKSVSSMQGHAVQDVSRTEKRGNMLPLAPVPIWTYPSATSAYTLYGHPSTHLTLSPEGSHTHLTVLGGMGSEPSRPREDRVVMDGSKPAKREWSTSLD